MKLKVLFGIVAQAILALQSQTVAMAGPQVEVPAQRFVCNTGYTAKECLAQIAVLRKALAKYPAAQLGTWTWVLVRSEDWKPILGSRGLRPDTPALSDPHQRATFIEEALMGQPSVRASHLMERWDMNVDRLLDFAVAHELGHTLCNEKDEREADRVARMLQERKPFACITRLNVAARAADATREERSSSACC